MKLFFIGRSEKNDFLRVTWQTQCEKYRIIHSTFQLSDQLSAKWYAMKSTPSPSLGTGTRWEIIGRHNARKAALRRLLATIRADQRLARRIEREAEIKKHKRRQSSAKQRRKHQRPAKKIQAKLF